MKTITVEMKRISFLSTKSFDEVIERLSAAIGHPDIQVFHQSLTAANTIEEIEMIVKKATGPSELMEFYRFDPGNIVSKDQRNENRRILRFLVGNPVIMKDMAKAVVDAASYAPVTILVSEEPGGVTLAYDSMASLLAPYGNESALEVARSLDAKLEMLLSAVAST